MRRRGTSVADDTAICVSGFLAELPPVARVVDGSAVFVPMKPRSTVALSVSGTFIAHSSTRQPAAYSYSGTAAPPRSGYVISNWNDGFSASAWSSATLRHHFVKKTRMVLPAALSAAPTVH